MLVLTRCPGETLLIGNDIKITILRRKGKRTILGIVAPKEIIVTRSELLQKINITKELSGK